MRRTNNARNRELDADFAAARRAAMAAERADEAAYAAKEPAPLHTHICTCSRAWHCADARPIHSFTNCSACGAQAPIAINPGDRRNPNHPHLPLGFSALAGAPARRKAPAPAASQAALLDEARPDTLIWHDFATDERTPYQQTSFL